MRFLLGQLPFHVLNALSHLGAGNPRFLKRCHGVRMSGFFSGQIEGLALDLSAERFDLATQRGHGVVQSRNFCLVFVGQRGHALIGFLVQAFGQPG